MIVSKHRVRVPSDDGCNGWYNLLNEPPSARRLQTNLRTDWLVIGAGFTGLAAARRIGQLRPNERIVTLEALRLGLGASGRNSGFVIDLPHSYALGGNDAKRKQKILSLNQAAISNLSELVDRFDIECEWSIAGKYQGAVGERGISHLTIFKKLLDEIGYPYKYLSKEELAPILGTRKYSAAIYTANTVLMQPAALVRGLGRTLPDNVELFEKTPVITLRRENGLWSAVTPNGEVRADNLLLGTDSYLSEFGFLRRRILPVMTYASMTRALTDGEMKLFKMSPHYFGLTPADEAGATLRLTSSRRILIRSQQQFVPHYQDDIRHRSHIRAAHRKDLVARYPELSDVPFIDTWGGVMGLSRNFETFFGSLGNKVWASGVHQGVGVARGTISGKLMAELAAGEDSEQVSDMKSVSGRPSLNPPEPLLSWGVKAAMRYKTWARRSEL